MKVTLPPGAMALQTDGGATYEDRSHRERALRGQGLGAARKRRQRSIEVTEPADLALVRDSALFNTPGYYLRADGGWNCPCGHGCWAWQADCPHCGRSRSQEATP